MSETPRERSSWLLIAAIPCLLLGYVLSLGPAAWIVHKAGWQDGDWQMRTAETFYAPLFHVAEWTRTEDWLERYMDLFWPED